MTTEQNIADTTFALSQGAPNENFSFYQPPMPMGQLDISFKPEEQEYVDKRTKLLQEELDENQ